MSDTPSQPTPPAPSPAPAPAAPAPAAPQYITIDDFAKVQLRVGKVLECRKHAKADKLLVMKVDVGTEVRQVCAGMAPYYPPEELVGKLIVVCVNLAPRMLRGEESNGMMLAATDAGDPGRVIFLSPEKGVAPGSKIS
jgi:methionyl-tRNA synthetase